MTIFSASGRTALALASVVLMRLCSIRLTDLIGEHGVAMACRAAEFDGLF